MFGPKIFGNQMAFRQIKLTMNTFFKARLFNIKQP